MRPNNICCIIIGEYTGRPACCVIAYKCPEVRVTIMDNEKALTETAPGYDPEMENIVKKCRNRNLFFSSEYSSVIRDADLIFISINDSNTAAGTTDMKQLEDMVKLIALHTESDTIVVENSRIPIQAAEKISAMLPSPRQSAVRFRVISNPQFLIEGSPVEDLLKPERVLIGCQNNPVSRGAAESLCELYENWVPRKNMLILNNRSTELCKLAGRAFIAQRISNMSSLSQLCEESEADISLISQVIGTDTKMGSKFLNPFAGFSLFQREVSWLISLCRSLNLSEAASYWQAVADMHEYQENRCLRKIEAILGPPRDKKIAIWGLCPDRNAADAVNSPVLEVCRWLLQKGCIIKIYDPQIPPEQIWKVLGFDSKLKVSICEDPYKASANASAIIICTDSDEYVNLSYSRIAREMQTPIIIDGKFLKEDNMKDHGITLHKLGLH